MLEMLKNWYSRRLSDPQAMGLLAILLFGFIAIYFFSDLIAPLLIAIVLAYLLEMPINFLTKKLKFPRMLATRGSPRGAGRCCCRPPCRHAIPA